MNNFKKNAKRWLYRFICNDGIYVSILGVIVITSFCVIQDKMELIDWKFFSSIVFVVIIQLIAGIIKKAIMRKLEDSAKLTEDYKSLAGRYRDSLVEFEDGEEVAKLPVKVISFLDGKKIVISDDKGDRYTLPEVVRDNFALLFESHNTSNVYNQLCIRVDDWKSSDGFFEMSTSRTTYFDSLVTNRAVDVKLADGMTIRDLFCFGPFSPELKTSPLSNHLGFNGFVESSDGYIPLVKRGGSVSIAKSTYGISVQASVKSKYALENDSREFGVDGLLNSIKKEIYDELRIKEGDLEPFSYDNHRLVAAYQDLLEGGKPQLMFYVKSYKSKKEIENDFYAYVTEHKKSIAVDGSHLEWIHKSELTSIKFSHDGMLYKEKFYRMVPSTTACLVILVDSIKEKETSSAPLVLNG